MLHSISRWLLPAATFVLSTASYAGHEPATQAKPDPFDAQASVPAAVYESAFTQYRAQPQQRLSSWKEANDEVSRIGGWRSYAREAAEAAPASASASAPAPARDPASAPAGPAKPSPKGSGAHQNH